MKISETFRKIRSRLWLLNPINYLAPRKNLLIVRKLRGRIASGKRDVWIGKGCIISDVDFSDCARIEDYVKLVGAPKMRLGNNVYINCFTTILGEITIEDNVMVSQFVNIWGRAHRFIKKDMPIWDMHGTSGETDQGYDTAPIVIKEGGLDRSSHYGIQGRYDRQRRGDRRKFTGYEGRARLCRLLGQSGQSSQIQRVGSMKRVVAVTASEFTAGFGTARALAHSGAHVTGFVTDRCNPCCVSRCFDELVEVTGWSNYVESLVSYGRELPQKAVLFPGNDITVAMVSENREALCPYYEMMLPEHDTLVMMTDKDRFGQWLISNGYAYPRTFTCTSREELENILETCEFPIVVKPPLRSDLWNSTSPQKAFIFESMRQAQATDFDFLSATPSVLVQEWIPGTDADIHYCLAYYDDYGKEMAFYTGHKLLQYPKGSGSGALVVGKHNDDVHHLTKEIFDKLNFRGIGSLEFKRHSGNGRYYVIEPTVGRNDVFSYVCVAGKTNLTMMAYKDMVKEPYHLKIKPRKAFWLNEETVFRSARKEGILAVARQMIKVAGYRPSFAFFSLRDPGPLITKLKTKFRSLLNRKTRPATSTLE